MPYTMLKDNQIKGLTDANKHTLVPCFVFNFRNENNDTYFMLIDNFNKMQSELNKKSFNCKDLEKYEAIYINSDKKRTRYSYNTEELIELTHL